MKLPVRWLRSVAGRGGTFVLGVTVLAVPGGCIADPIVVGHIELYNRTSETLVIRAEHASEDEIRLAPCSSMIRDSFPLNAVSVAPASGRTAAGIQRGVETSPLVIIVTDHEPQYLTATPTTLPSCGGTMP